MKFETLHGSRNRKIVIGSVVLFLLGITIFFNTSMAKYRVTERIPLVRGKISYSPYDISVTSKLLVGDNEYIELDEIPNSDLVSLADYTCTNDAELSYVSVEDGYLITNLTNKGTKCEAIFASLQSEEFDYSGKIDEYIVPTSGEYLLEVWGAEGGSGTNSYGTRVGGYGGYAKGVVTLSKNDSLFIGIGGKGVNGASTSIQTGGFNGGGSGLYHGGSGGGATHIATSTGELKDLVDNKSDVLIVAGGGGGGAVTNDGNCSDGGSGGGISGTDSTSNACYGTTDTLNGYGTGGNQEQGGTQSANYSSSLGSGGTGSFGLGATTTMNTSAYGAGGGGGGYYGGGSSTIAGAGGGSGYIGNSKLISNTTITKSMYCYNCEPSTNADTLTYSIEDKSDSAIKDMPKSGDGYAKITLLEGIPYKPKFDIEVTKENKNITISVTPSTDNLFETVKYYYSVNSEFIESVDNTYTFENLDAAIYTVKVYIIDNKNIKSDTLSKEVTITNGITMENILANKTISTRTDFSTVLTSDTTGIVYTAEDNDGTSYYFAGAPTDNWVKFGGFYWRIIRINGDGSIRLIYNGTSTSTTGASTLALTGVGYNIVYYNNMCVGYMYTNGQVHGYTTSSTIKTELDNWYDNNLANYIDKIDTNAGFCNDRVPYTTNTGEIIGGGIADTTTYYAASIRLHYNNNSNNSVPSFGCSDSNDLFTLSIASKGNKKLSKPIGLITADEVAYAGGVLGSSLSNKTYYLYNSQDYWTMTPYFANSGGALVVNVRSDGNIFHNRSDTAIGVRPVINLKADTSFNENATGTSTNPYTVIGAE